MAFSRNRHAITDIAGDEVDGVSDISPPPSLLKLVADDPVADSQWKLWLNNLYEYIGTINQALADSMSQDFYAEVAKGNVAGHSLVHKFGRNSAIPNGGWERVALLSVAAFHLSAATTVRIKAGGNAADTAAGAGAREVTVQGIDSNNVELSETIATAGASASASTTASFWRIHRAWVSDCGTYSGSNTGAVDIENTAGTQDLIQIAAGEGQTQYAGFTTSENFEAYLLSVNLTVDTGKTANFKLMTRESITDTTAGVPAVRIKKEWNGLGVPFEYKPRSPEKIGTSLTDIWIEAYGNGGVADVTADYELLLVDTTA